MSPAGYQLPHPAVHTGGFEPPTSDLSGRRSNQLSYVCVLCFKNLAPRTGFEPVISYVTGRRPLHAGPPGRGYRPRYRLRQASFCRPSRLEWLLGLKVEGWSHHPGSNRGPRPYQGRALDQLSYGGVRGGKFGANVRGRTGGLLVTNQALYRLSYAGKLRCRRIYPVEPVTGLEPAASGLQIQRSTC